MKENSIEEDIEELKRLLYRNELTKYGKRKLINYYERQEKDYKRLLKENEELKEKYDKDTNQLQNQIYRLNVDKINNYISKAKIEKMYIEMEQEYERKVYDNNYNRTEVKKEEMYKRQVYEKLLESEEDEI